MKIAPGLHSKERARRHNHVPAGRLRTSFGRYAIATAIISASVLARLCLWPVLGESSPYLTSYLAVTTIAVWYGFGPAMLATGIIAGVENGRIYTSEGLAGYGAPQLVHLGWMVLSNVFIGMIGNKARTTQRRAERESESVRRAHEALRATEQRYVAIHDRAPFAIALTRYPEETITDVNEAWEKLTGFSRKNAIGHTHGQLGLTFDPAALQTMHAQLRKQGLVRELEMPFSTREGVRRIGSFSFDLVEIYGQRYLLSTAADITDRKQAQEALQRNQEELKSANAAAEQARVEAEAASKAKDEFLAVLSHELRNPLNPVLATASLLEQDMTLDSEVREQVDIIRRNAELEARLIDDLLDVTRIARGKVELHREVLDLRTIINRTVEVCRPEIDARRLEFATEIDERAYWVSADATRLQQALWNLLKNAVKFTPPTGRVELRCRADRNGHVAITVSDTGEGIAPEVLPKLFHAFEQGGRPMTRQFGGLGLGLAISKAMVEMHGGSVAAQSPGKGLGATFTVFLPLLDAPPQISTAPKRSAARSLAKLSRSLRILLVEDHEDSARIMKRLLSSDGHQVLTAGDIATAKRLVESGRFDLLLSDLGLPDGNGLDLIRWVRAAGNGQPAIALSGYGQESDLRLTREAGFQGHLVKPLNIRDLRETIARVIVETNELEQDPELAATSPT